MRAARFRERRRGDEENVEVTSLEELYAEDEVDSLSRRLGSRSTSEMHMSEAKFPRLVFVLEDGERS